MGINYGLLVISFVLEDEVLFRKFEILVEKGWGIIMFVLNLELGIGKIDVVLVLVLVMVMVVGEEEEDCDVDYDDKGCLLGIFISYFFFCFLVFVF